MRSSMNWVQTSSEHSAGDLQTHRIICGYREGLRISGIAPCQNRILKKDMIGA